MATLWTTVLVSNGTKLLHGAHTAVVRRLHTLILNMNVRLSFGSYNHSSLEKQQLKYIII